MTPPSRPDPPADGDAPAIRPALGSDIAAVAALWVECGLTMPYNDPAADIAFCRATASAELFVTGEPGAIVATVMAGHDGHRGWLYYMAVDPERRGEGLARRLVAHAEAWLAALGVRKVNLMIRETNTEALGFYERVGYEVTPRVVMGRWIAPAAGKVRARKQGR